MMRILVTDGMDQQAVSQLRANGHEVVEQFYEPDQLGAALREFDAVVIRSATKIRAPHIEQAKGSRLKLIIRAGVGIDNIDVADAEAAIKHIVTCEYGTEGYIRSDYVDLTESSSSNGDIVDTAMQHLGTRYVYGGASPSGFDCSGFTMYIYGQYDYSLPHTATGQWQSGLGTRVYSISELQPGDLVFFNDPSRNAGKACSHVGIYVGNGKHIHSSSSRSGGVIISDLTSGYYNTYFVGGIHV